MFTPEQLLELAQSIQPKLHDLLPADRATAIDQELTKLIARSNAGEKVAEEILELLDNQPELEECLAIGTIRKFDSLPGNSSARPREPKYQCPECHKTYAELPQNRIPKCKDHPDKTLTLIQS
jgi:hypothetical protein